uniref:BTB domain-containing protein n=1 Tax=Panagrolaimus sp. ES5 TaxID=591445 RepID=A0AC34FKC5_9BILA
MSLIDTKFPTACLIRKKWKIKREAFSNKKRLCDSLSLTNFPGVKYYLCLHPKYRNTNQVRVSLFCICNMTPKVNAFFTISVKSASRHLNYGHTFEKSEGYGSTLCTYEKLLNPENNKFFVDGVMEIDLVGTLNCQETVRKSPESASLAAILYKSDDKDFVLAAEDQQLMVHKWILRANSSVFHKKLSAGIGKINIDDFSFNTVKIAMEHLYERDIKNLVDAQNAFEVLNFADQYQIKTLHNVIQNKLIDELSEANVVKFANISVKCNALELRECCICFLMKFFGKQTVINDIKQLHNNIAGEVGQRCLLSVLV